MTATTLFLSDADVAALADWPSAIDALRRAYSTDIPLASVPPRSMARAPGMWLRSLTAISPLDGRLGCKLISASPRIRTASYLISLFDPATMNLLALIDGARITGLRTAATATVALDALATRKPLQVAVLGSGFEADTLLTALAAARPLGTVRIFSPTRERREAFAQRFRDSPGLDATACDTPQAAVDGADTVLCAARARNEVPILEAEWLSDGTTIASIGSTLPEQREVATSVVRRAHCVVADIPVEVAHDSGDMVAAAREGIVFGEKLHSLNDLMRGLCTARASLADVVMYKSVGSALQDVVIASLLFDRAVAAGRGTPLPATIEPIRKQ